MNIFKNKKIKNFAILAMISIFSAGISVQAQQSGNSTQFPANGKPQNGKAVPSPVGGLPIRGGVSNNRSVGGGSGSRNSSSGLGTVASINLGSIITANAGGNSASTGDDCLPVQVNKAAYDNYIDTMVAMIKDTVGNKEVLDQFDDSFKTCRAALDRFTEIVAGVGNLFKGFSWEGVASWVMSSLYDMVINIVKEKIESSCQAFLEKTSSFTDKASAVLNNIKQIPNIMSSVDIDVTYNNGNIDVATQLSGYTSIKDLTNAIY